MLRRKLSTLPVDVQRDCESDFQNELYIYVCITKPRAYPQA